MTLCFSGSDIVFQWIWHGVSTFSDDDIVFQWLWHCISVTMTLCFSGCDIVFQWRWHCVSVAVTLCFSDDDIVFQWLWHCVSVAMTLCFSGCDIVFQWRWHCVSVAVTLCFSDDDIVFQWLWHCVSVAMTLCFSGYDIVFQWVPPRAITSRVVSAPAIALTKTAEWVQGDIGGQGQQIGGWVITVCFRCSPSLVLLEVGGSWKTCRLLSYCVLSVMCPQCHVSSESCVLSDVSSVSCVLRVMCCHQQLLRSCFEDVTWLSSWANCFRQVHGKKNINSLNFFCLYINANKRLTCYIFVYSVYAILKRY